MVETRPHKGLYLHTSLGGKFWPGDPRPEDVFIEDIANGLAGIRRYTSQGHIARHYSVAEHSVLLTRRVLYGLRWPALDCMCVLMHDASEAYLGDLVKAVKPLLDGYREVEAQVDAAIFRKFGLTDRFPELHEKIKEMDNRIVPVEKKAIFPSYQPRVQEFAPLDNIDIQLWSPITAREEFLVTFERLQRRLAA